jgi:hypothetical protein
MHVSKKNTGRGFAMATPPLAHVPTIGMPPASAAKKNLTRASGGPAGVDLRRHARDDGEFNLCAARHAAERFKVFPPFAVRSQSVKIPVKH